MYYKTRQNSWFYAICPDGFSFWVFFLGFIYLTEGLLSSFFFIFLCSQIFFCECYCITDTVRTTSEDFTCLYAF